MRVSSDTFTALVAVAGLLVPVRDRQPAAGVPGVGRSTTEIDDVLQVWDN
jgi:hypothetical protein